MSELSAEDAARYALGRDVLMLVAAAIVGGALVVLGSGWLGVRHGGPVYILLNNLFGALVVVGGLALQIAGSIGLLYKLVADATADG